MMSRRGNVFKKSVSMRTANGGEKLPMKFFFPKLHYRAGTLASAMFRRMFLSSMAVYVRMSPSGNKRMTLALKRHSIGSNLKQLSVRSLAASTPSSATAVGVSPADRRSELPSPEHSTRAAKCYFWMRLPVPSTA